MKNKEDLAGIMTIPLQGLFVLFNIEGWIDCIEVS